MPPSSRQMDRQTVRYRAPQAGPMVTMGRQAVSQHRLTSIQSKTFCRPFIRGLSRSNKLRILQFLSVF